VTGVILPTIKEKKNYHPTLNKGKKHPTSEAAVELRYRAIL